MNDGNNAISRRNPDQFARVISRDIFNLQRLQERKNAPLQMIVVELENKILYGVIASCTQISIIMTSCITKYFKTPFRSIILKSAFGNHLKAQRH